MKRLTILVSLICYFASINAQLKVYQNGCVGITNSNDNCYHSLGVNGSGLSASDTLSYNLPVYVKRGSAWKGFNMVFAVDAMASTNMSSGRSIGIKATAGKGANGYNYGVMGMVAGTRNGAGIYGGVGGSNGTYIDDIYAGYFDGDTKIDGNVIVTGNVYADMLTVPSSNSSTSLRASASYATEDTPVSSRLSRVNAFINYKERAESIQNEIANDSTENGRTISQIEEQLLGRLHYGLCASQIEEEFPELVYENEKGEKFINYLELIPLLVQSIGELTDELAAIKSSNNSQARQMTDIDQISMVKKNRLFQNSPNPFSGRTEIRFTLADDTKSAYIYIFDMQGKTLQQVPVDASMQSIGVDGYGLSSGMYIYSLVVNGQEIDTKRMILAK